MIVTSGFLFLAEVLSRDWERCVNLVTRRKKELTAMLDDSRRWDNVKAELEVWLTASEKTIAGPKASECNFEELHRELNNVEVRDLCNFLALVEIYQFFVCFRD